MTAPRRLRLDFAAPIHRATWAGGVLCVVGVAAAIGVGFAFDSKLIERNQLDARIGAIATPHRAVNPGDTKVVEEAASVESELAVPWTLLLSELESASHDLSDTISLLQVAPDPSKRTVRITAEARNLPDALAYLVRLQQSKVLRYPMLESHERRKDDPEHPVRIKLVAEWRT